MDGVVNMTGLTIFSIRSFRVIRESFKCPVQLPLMKVGIGSPYLYSVWVQSEIAEHIVCLAA